MSKYFKGLILFATLIGLSGFAHARGPGNQAYVKVPFNAADGSSFSAEDMTGPAQTSVMDVRGFTYLTFYLDVLAVSGTADVTLACNTGPTSDDVNYPLQSEAISAGEATLSDYTLVKEVTTSDKYPVTVTLTNKGYLQCTITCASGTVSAVAYTW